MGQLNGAGWVNTLPVVAMVKTENCDYRPVIVVQTPASPTIKSMAKTVLKGLGDPNYSKGTEIEMTERIIILLEKQKVRMLIIDELQNMIDRNSEILNDKVANWLKGLTNIEEYKVSIVIVGLERTKIIFNNEQLRGRFREAVPMTAFDWNDNNQRKNLKGFLKAVEKKLKLQEGLSLYTNEMSFRFYCASSGLVRYIMKIITEARRLAEKREDSVIEMGDFARAYSTVVCGNSEIAVNPFLEETTDGLQAALAVVVPSPPIRRRRKKSAETLDSKTKESDL